MPQVGYEVRLYNKGGQYVSAEADDEKDATEKAEAKFEDYFGKAEIAQKIVKDVKAEKIKVQVAIQGEELRVSGKKRDDLQVVITFLKSQDYGIPLQFINMRE